MKNDIDFSNIKTTHDAIRAFIDAHRRIERIRRDEITQQRNENMKKKSKITDARCEYSFVHDGKHAGDDDVRQSVCDDLNKRMTNVKIRALKISHIELDDIVRDEYFFTCVIEGDENLIVDLVNAGNACWGNDNDISVTS